LISIFLIDILVVPCVVPVKDEHGVKVRRE